MMRYEITVDDVARICIWRTRRHYGVMHADLRIPTKLKRRIDDWIDRYADLYAKSHATSWEKTHDDWLDFDREGIAIAKLLKPALGPNAEVYYRHESSDESEKVM
jgi:hypothetical protein